MHRYLTISSFTAIVMVISACTDGEANPVAPQPDPGKYADYRFPNLAVEVINGKNHIVASSTPSTVFDPDYMSIRTISGEASIADMASETIVIGGKPIALCRIEGSGLDGVQVIYEFTYGDFKGSSQSYEVVSTAQQDDPEGTPLRGLPDL